MAVVRSVAAVALVVALAAACGAPPADASPMRKGPYIQDVGPTSVEVMWQLGEPAAARLIVTRPDAATDAPRVLDVAPADVATTRVDHLLPRTRYEYRVEVGGRSWSGEWTTAPRPGDDAALSLVVLGDSRDGAEVSHKLMMRADELAPDLILGTGDIVDDGASESDWQEFFDSAGIALRHVAYYPALGNHERRGRREAPVGYRRYFSLPGGTADYYSVSYGATRVVMLDSTALGAALTDETAWLDRELASARHDATIRHIVVCMHHAMFSVGRHGGSPGLRDRWTPLFERARVTMVISGHDHAYQRAEHGGVRYFVTGGGGAPLYAKSGSPAAADAQAVKMFESAWHLLAVTIRDDRVEVTALRVDGSTIETTGWVDDVAGAKHAAAVAAASPAPAQAAGGGGGGDADLDDEAPVGTTWLWLLVAAALCAVVGGALIRRDRRRQP